MIVPTGADVEFQVDDACDAVGAVCKDLQGGVKWGILVLDAGDCKGVVCPVCDVGRAGNIVAVSLAALLGAALAAVGYQVDVTACIMGEVYQLPYKCALGVVLVLSRQGDRHQVIQDEHGATEALLCVAHQTKQLLRLVDAGCRIIQKKQLVLPP